ncbi:MAG: hypothetical protein EA340_12680 [Nitriliruptor sp.]|nr:MAG: hypothetical protein EA340_12680 [Nitriliruptor sp.]
MIILIILALLVVPLGLVIWNVVDVAKRTDAAFESAGQRRMVWIVLPVALMFIGVGWIVSVIYFVAIRPKVVDAEP